MVCTWKCVVEHERRTFGNLMIFTWSDVMLHDGVYACAVIRAYVETVCS